MRGHEGKDEIHVRGVSRDFQDEILEAAYVEFMAPLRFREAVRSGRRPNTWTLHKKTLDKTYDKRMVLRVGQGLREKGRRDPLGGP